ncbi:unnamed protein product [Rhizophagus irregularis]|nr:unnamed protein product [Rhizophagus irregularis]
MICLDPRTLFDSAKFIDLPAPLLEVILKRNDLNLIEIEIWEYLIKWGLARDEILNEEVSKWNREKFKILERILHKFITLVRFYDISSEDYFDKVRPYEGIIPEKLQEENLKYYLIPGYTPNKYISRNCIESVIINPKHTVYFVNWINGIIGKARYKFKLLYRASRDGNTAAAFHAKCDNKGATVVIVKIRNLDQIVGGYNPLFWDSSKTDKSTKNSFLFKFTDKNNLLSANVVYSKGDQYSVRCYVSSGPFFGFGDLYVNYYPGVWYSYIHSYPTLNLPSSFSADDYKVFQVIKI